MKLYASPNSPFSARVRLAALAKGIDIPEAPLPPGGLKSEAFTKINPIAKIPVLVLDNQTSIPESTAILRYLEDCFPRPSLLPESPAERARVNMLVGIVDAYVMEPVIRLFPHLDPALRDRRVVEAEVARWTAGAAWLAEAMTGAMPEAEAGLTLADCVLAPSLHLSIRISAMLGLDVDPLRRQRALVDYEARLQRHPLAGPILEALTSAQHAYDLKAGRPSVAERHTLFS
ncbi:hypothetical protein D3C72_675100 [compost metagenome]